MHLYAALMTWEDLDQTLEAGADGVIFTMVPYGLRGMCRIAPKQAREAIERCHRQGAKALFMMNAFLYEEDVDGACQQLLELVRAGADGIYFADEALLAYAQAMGFADRLIYQSDTLVTNHLDVDFYVNEGCQGVVLAKEITLQEILAIAQASTAAKLEIIAHGHVLMMHSRRPLLSSYMEFIGKQDKVKVQERMDLSLVEDTRSEHFPIVEDKCGTHIYSGYVLNSFVQMQELMDAGIKAMRIDGCFHSSEQMLLALRLYDAIRKGTCDGAQAKQQFHERYKDLPLSDGFYYRSTGLSK
ncbi:MAG: U32 family peptidase [Erysipelotrichaceae bacterium]|nr:U32 family peptidase [Erysipelotrichaceae bacterium]